MVSIAKSARGVLLALAGLAACHRTPTTEEQSAMGAVDQIQKLGAAEETYRATHGRYAKSLDELLMHVWVRGYTITLEGNGDKFAIHADSNDYQQSGNRSFFTDQTHVVRYTDGPGPANAASAAVK